MLCKVGCIFRLVRYGNCTDLCYHLEAHNELLLYSTKYHTLYCCLLLSYSTPIRNHLVTYIVTMASLVLLYCGTRGYLDWFPLVSIDHTLCKPVITQLVLLPCESFHLLVVRGGFNTKFWIVTAVLVRIQLFRM